MLLFLITHDDKYEYIRKSTHRKIKRQDICCFLVMIVPQYFSVTNWFSLNQVNVTGYWLIAHAYLIFLNLCEKKKVGYFQFYENFSVGSKKEIIQSNIKSKNDNKINPYWQIQHLIFHYPLLVMLLTIHEWSWGRGTTPPKISTTISAMTLKLGTIVYDVKW